jgi:hypothetical protein
MIPHKSKKFLEGVIRKFGLIQANGIDSISRTYEGDPGLNLPSFKPGRNNVQEHDPTWYR